MITAVDGNLWKLNRYYDAGVRTDEQDWELHDLSLDAGERENRCQQPNTPGAVLEDLWRLSWYHRHVEQGVRTSARDHAPLADRMRRSKSEGAADGYSADPRRIQRSVPLRFGMSEEEVDDPRAEVRCDARDVAPAVDGPQLDG